MASDQDLLERIDDAAPSRVFEVETVALVREGRRRRLTQRGWVALAVVAVSVAAFVAPSGGGTTVAGFTVFEADGKQVIGLTIPSGSMAPTLRPGDIAAVDIDAYTGGRDPQRGEVIAFRTTPVAGCGDQVFVKRVAGVAGDTVEQVDGTVVVNGRPLDGPTPDRVDADLGPWNVPRGRLFVVGDNLSDSNDSRFSMGLVSVKDVLGRVDLSIDLDRADVPAPVACVVSGPAPTG